MAKLDDIIADSVAQYWCATCKMGLAAGQIAYHRLFNHEVRDDTATLP